MPDTPEFVGVVAAAIRNHIKKHLSDGKPLDDFERKYIIDLFQAIENGVSPKRALGLLSEKEIEQIRQKHLREQTGRRHFERDCAIVDWVAQFRKYFNQPLKGNRDEGVFEMVAPHFSLTADAVEKIYYAMINSPEYNMRRKVLNSTKH